MIAQIAMMAVKTAIDEMMARRQENIFNRHISGRTGVRHHRQNGCSPTYTYTDKVKYTLNNQNTYKSRNISIVKDAIEKPIIIQAKKEDNQIVRSL